MASTLSAKHFLCCAAAASITVAPLPASTSNYVMRTTKTLTDIYWNERGVVAPPLTLRVKRSLHCTVALGAHSGTRASFLLQMKPCRAAHVTASPSDCFSVSLCQLAQCASLADTERPLFSCYCPVAFFIKIQRIVMEQTVTHGPHLKPNGEAQWDKRRKTTGWAEVSVVWVQRIRDV